MAGGMNDGKCIVHGEVPELAGTTFADKVRSYVEGRPDIAVGKDTYIRGRELSVNEALSLYPEPCDKSPHHPGR